MTAQSAAGWYPDPQGAAAARFFDGAAWTPHTRGAFEQPAPAPSVPAPLRTSSASRSTPVPNGDGVATASLVLGILALVVNVAFVPSILGIVLGARALRRGALGARRSMATAGIVLGGAGVLLSLAVIAIVLAALPGFLRGFDQGFVQGQNRVLMEKIGTRIQGDAAAQGVELSIPQCTTPGPLAAGVTSTCTATTDAGTPVTILVTFDDSRGDWHWAAER